METTTIKNLVKIYYDSQDFRKSAANRLRPYMNPEESVEALMKPTVDENELIALIQKKKTEFAESVFGCDIYTITQQTALFVEEIDHLKAVIEYQKTFTDPFPETCLYMIKEYTRIEKKIALLISNQILAYPIHTWLTDQKGIGPMLAGSLIGYIGDISKFDKVTSLWAYAGMGVIEICETCKKRHIRQGYKGAWIQHTADRLKEQNDKVLDKSKKKKGVDFIKDAESKLCHCETPCRKRISQRKISGQLLDYNPDFKQLCYLIGDQFIKNRESPYRKLYDQFRLEYENRPDLMKERDERKKGSASGTGHIHDMARRKTVKIFLSHLWETWRKLEGLPIPEPYAIGILGHSDKIAPFTR